MVLTTTDPLPPMQAESVWEVLKCCDEDGSDDLHARVMADGHGVVVIYQPEEDRRWVIHPSGWFTWGPIPDAWYRRNRY